MSNIADRLRNLPTLGQPAEEPSHELILGRLEPDSPALGRAGPAVHFDTVRNCLPRHDGGYGPIGELSALSTALDNIAKAAISVTDENKVTWTYAGDGNSSGTGKLYESNDYTYIDVSKGTNYSVAEEEGWEFAQFRTQIIATTIAEPVQTKTIGAAGDFADLITGTEKPKAKHIATVGNFVVLGDISDTTDGLVPNRVWWSGFGDPTTFDPSTTTQSDFEDLADGGPVQRLIGGQEYGVIMQTSMIRRLTYRGDTAVFDFDPVDRTRGTPIPNSVSARGRLLAYIAEEGFMMFDGLESTEIGDGQIDRSFWNEFDPNDRHLVSSAFDPNEKLIMWAYPSFGGTNGLPNKLLVFNYDRHSRQWATIDVECDVIFTGEFLGINVDTPISEFNDIDNSIYSNTSIDSAIFKGGYQTLSAFDREHKQATFEGQALAMRMETKDLSLFSGQEGVINQARPIIEGPVSTFIAKRTVQGGSLEYLSAKQKDSNGLCHFDDQSTAARYHKFCMSTNLGDSWDKASGVQLYARPAGSFR